MGIYMMNKVLKFIPNDSYYGFDHLMLDLIKANKEVKVRNHKGYWLDIGRPDEYIKATEEFEEKRSYFLMTDILITGGRGFIGKNLTKKLDHLGLSYILIDSKNGDINNQKTFSSLPKVKTVIHLAGKSFVPSSWQDNNNFFLTNIIDSNVLNYCKNVGAKLIMASSYVYGIPEELPIKESHPVRPNNPYVLSKFLANNLWNLNIFIVN